MNQASGASRTFVVGQGLRVVFWQVLASSAAEETPGRLRPSAPDPIPVAVLGRLAVDPGHQSNSLALSRDATFRVIQVTDLIGMR